ncbi:MAG: acyltransferase [Proteobacteria bacterium]|nr:acyltransferase [Pseudomonadota bacterium]
MGHTSPNSASTLVYRPLGTFRFVLAILVVAQHYTNFAPLAFQQAIVPLGLGSIAVLVFFAVSGFVIAEAIEVHYRGRAGAFLLNRSIRIFPPLLAATTVTLLIVALLLLGGPFRHFEMHKPELVTMDVLTLKNIAANYIQAIPGATKLGPDMTHPLITIVWSIRTELMFYLVMAVVMFAPASFYHRALGLAGAAALAFYYVMALTGAGPETVRLIPFFVFGVAVYYALRGSLFGFGVSVLSWAFSLIAFADIGDQLNDVARAAFGPFNMPARVAILAVLLIMIPALAHIRLTRARPQDQALGDLSYPLYLNHFGIMFVVGAFWPQLGWTGFALTLAAALALSVVMFRLVEPGLDSLRKQVRHGRIGLPAVLTENKLARIPV